MSFAKAWRTEIDLKRQIFNQARERFVEAELELANAREALMKAAARLRGAGSGRRFARSSVRQEASVARLAGHRSRRTGRDVCRSVHEMLG